MTLFTKTAPRDDAVHRVVICDDQAEVRRLYKRFLGKTRGFEVVGEAANGGEALALVEDCRPDVLLLDFAMPEVSGVEVLRQLKTVAPETKIVVVTSFFGMGEEAVGMGADAFVSKTSRPKELIATVRSVVAQPTG